MSRADGPEQRLALELEALCGEDDLDDVIEDTPLHEQLSATLLLLHEARARLADIAMGADMMLQPVMNAQGWVKSYIEEVRRVARAPL